MSFSYAYGFIPYNLLDSMSNEYNVKFKYRNMILYIDVYSVYKRFLDRNFGLSNIQSISVNLLNLAGHYRNYFRSRGIENIVIFMINTIPYSISSNYISEDCLKTIPQEINSIYKDSNDMFKLAGVMAPRFPGLYYIHNSNIGSSTLIYKLMLQNRNKFGDHESIVISNDIYAYQFPIFNPETYVIRTSNNKIVHKDNAISLWYNKSSTAKFSGLNTGLLPMIMAYSHERKLNLRMYYNINVALNMIRSNIENGKILNGYNNPNAIIKVLNRDSTNDIGDIGLYNRYCICDLNTLFHNSEVPDINESLTVSKPLPINITADICDKYFARYNDPVNITFLYR